MAIKISDIIFGKNDAHNELQEFGEEFYLESFLTYDKYKINSFINGENYFICGNKGTGKTALLKYLECVFSKDECNLVIPIRFKSQFDNMDKKSMRYMASNIREEIVEEISVSKETSYTLIWQIYLINKILKHSNQGEYYLFEDSPEYRNLIKLLQGLYAKEGTDMPKSKVIALANQKGGTGKTTTTLNLGIGLAKWEKSTAR